MYKMITTSALGLILSSTAALATAATTESRLNSIEDKLEIIEKSLIQEKPSTENIGKFSLKPGPKFEMGESKFSIGGVLITNAAFFSNDNHLDHDNGVEIANASFSFDGEINKDWLFCLETNLLADAVNLDTAFLGYQGFEGWQILAGQFSEPFSFEDQSSSKWTSFVRRSSVNTFVPGFNIGLLATTNAERYTFSVGAFGDGSGKISTENGALGLSGRITLLPYLDGDKLVHLGASGSYKTLKTARYKEYPGSKLGMPTIDTGDITGIRHVDNLGVEFATAGHGASLQSEFVTNFVERRGFRNSLFYGGYAQVTYTLTGETRTYNHDSGTFGRVSPANPFHTKTSGWGAWEVAYRFNMISLKSRDVNGGSQREHAIALNWYVNDYVKFAANYLNINANTSTEVGTKSNPEVYLLQTQVMF